MCSIEISSLISKTVPLYTCLACSRDFEKIFIGSTPGGLLSAPAQSEITQSCSSSARLNVLRAVRQGTVLVFKFNDCLINFLAYIILKSIVECLTFLFLPPRQDLFLPPVVHVRRCHVSDSFAMAPLVVNSINAVNARPRKAPDLA